jgi:hypothetical protein
MGILHAIRAAREVLDRESAPITLRDAGLTLDNPAVSLSSPAAYQLLSGSYPTVSGEAINTESALRIGTVYACIRVIGNGVAGMPAKIYAIDGANKAEAVDHSLYYLLTQEPNPEMSRSRWLHSGRSRRASSSLSARASRSSTSSPTRQPALSLSCSQRM